jgi:hypothetical protein
MKYTDSPLWDHIASLPPRGEDEHRYLLINQAAWSGQVDALRALRGFDRCALFGQAPSACEDGATPFLLRLDGNISETSATRPLRVLCAEGCYASAVHVIDSGLAIQPLAQALTERCDARISDEQRMVLRYFDTRVFEAVLDHFTAAQLSDLVSCATRWWFAGRQGLLDPVYVNPWPQEDIFKAPWQLSLSQEHALLMASEPDTMIDLLTRSGVEPLLVLPYPERYPVVRDMIASAKAWGLEGTSDQAAYCTLSLHQGTDLAEDPLWKQLLPRVKRGEMSFTQALQQADAPTP